VSKKIKLMLEFSLHGKNGIPQVSFIGEGKGIGHHGVPLSGVGDVPGTVGGDAFAAFSKAAHKFCKEMRDQGEFEPEDGK
jgi:hypothetical protein